MTTDTLNPRSWLYPTPRGLYCEPGDFYIDPAVAVTARRDHPRPWRPCAAGPSRRAGHARDAGDHARPLRGHARHRPAAAEIRRKRAGRRRRCAARAGRPHPGLGAGRAGIQGPAHRRLGRLQAPARSDLPALRAGALRRLHHRGDLRPAGVPPSLRRRRDRQAAALASRPFPSAPIWWASTRSASASA